MFSRLLMVCVLTLPLYAQAHDGVHIAGQQLAADQINTFVVRSELTTLVGESRFVALAKLPQPLLINFWGVDCPPCIAELPLLAEFAKQQPMWTVVLVSTDLADTARDFLRRRPLPMLPNLLILKASANPRASLRSAGNISGGLPYTLATKAQLPAEKVTLKTAISTPITCFSQAGMLEASDFNAAVAACSP